MPDFPPSISAASTTIQPAEVEVLTPAKMASRADGIAISKSICRLLAWKMVPTLRYMFCTLEMPACVLTTTGISAPINTIRILGNSPVPNHMVINGTQARGGTERKGPSSALAFLFQPIRMPKEIPSSQAKARAINTRRRLAQMWPKRLSCLIGFSISSRNRFQISTGEGKVLFSAPAAKNHSRIRSRTETTGNTA